MTTSAQGITGQQRAILELLADGASYEQVLQAYPDLPFRALGEAIRAALGAIDSGGSGPNDYIAEVRKRQPNAYRPWSTILDDELEEAFREGLTIQAIASEMGRTPGAICPANSSRDHWRG